MIRSTSSTRTSASTTTAAAATSTATAAAHIDLTLTRSALKQDDDTTRQQPRSRTQHVVKDQKAAPLDGSLGWAGDDGKYEGDRLFCERSSDITEEKILREWEWDFLQHIYAHGILCELRGVLLDTASCIFLIGHEERKSSRAWAENSRSDLFVFSRSPFAIFAAALR
ncbi:hypothetical protein INR49_000066 [Caranx melampygus]|nr:hypothetical protein INR49_000066 [Caranx melampygus]